MKVRLRSAAVLAAGLLLTGCGIQGTRVIQAGEPAKVMFPDQSGRTLLYFISPAGEVVPVSRFVSTSSVEKALTLLFSGPDRLDLAAGLTSKLPPYKGPAQVEGKKAADELNVILKMDVQTLPVAARYQIVCTTAFVFSPQGRTEVTITGMDGVIERQRCPLVLG